MTTATNTNTKPTMTELKLQFAERVLTILEAHTEWSGDTIDEIGMLAIDMGLGDTNEDQEFVVKEDSAS